MIFIISGPGGVGKGTVVTRVLELLPDVSLSRSWTTRERRNGEPADAYVFVDRPTFEQNIAAGGFLEWTEFAGTGALYGTPLIDSGERDRDVMLEIELDGAKQVKELHPDAVLVLIVAPSREVQAERLRGRGDAEENVARRLAVGDREQREGREIADHIVVNDQLERAAQEVAGIIARYREAR